MLAGSITPLIVLYVATTVSYLVSGTGHWAFLAMWVMSFFAFCVLMLAGLTISLIGWPTNPLACFGVGLSISAALIFLVIGY